MLRVGILAYNESLTTECCKMIAYSDEDAKITNTTQRATYMGDGTAYFAISDSELNNRGRTLDQLILVDDSRWEIFKHKETLIDYLEKYVLNDNLKNTEYRIQMYEI